MVSQMDKESTNLSMEMHMKVRFRMESDKDEEFIFGRMVINLLEIGKLTKWKEMGNYCCQMECKCQPDSIMIN